MDHNIIRVDDFVRLRGLLLLLITADGTIYPVMDRLVKEGLSYDSLSSVIGLSLRINSVLEHLLQRVAVVTVITGVLLIKHLLHLHAIDHISLLALLSLLLFLLLHLLLSLKFGLDGCCSCSRCSISSLLLLLIFH